MPAFLNMLAASHERVRPDRSRRKPIARLRLDFEIGEAAHGAYD